MPEGPAARWADGVLLSDRFADIYFPQEGGLAQSRSVFLAGCGLPEAWAGRRRFTVAELGFGTGLNMLALIDLWRRTRPPGAVLNLFSVEAYPLPLADAAAALAAFPELADLAGPLLAQWPRVARGVQRIDWLGLGVMLDVAVMDAAEALDGWDGTADAWFLDGFAPAKNPGMWSADLLAAVGGATAPGGRAATWSVAARVRDGLSAAGFAVARKPGFGRKAERLEATMPGASADAAVPRVAIVGAGVAGAALALSLGDLGVRARVFAAGPMASGNPAALISPRLAAGSRAGAQLHAQAFRRAVARVCATAPGAVIARGVRRRLPTAEARARAAETCASGLFDPGTLRMDADGLWLADALVIAPDRLRAAWLAAAGVQPEALEVRALDRDRDGWWLLAADARVGPFDAVCVAAGLGSATLSGVALRPVRGQVSVAALPLAGPPQSWGGYLIPTDHGLMFGATQDRGDPDPEVREADHRRNLEGLARVHPEVAAALGAELEAGALKGFAGVRAATGDHQPLAGALGDGLFVLGGLGGRGFTLAPLLAEHVAAAVAAAPSPLLRAVQALVDPRRPGVAQRRQDYPACTAYPKT